MRASIAPAVLLVAILPRGVLASPRADTGDSGPQTAEKERTNEKALAEKAKPSFFTDLWQLDEEARIGRPPVTFHRTNYLLPFSYNGSPNQAPWQVLDPPQHLLKAEVTFQLSFKAKAWEDIFRTDTDLWLAYTQRSFWQAYDIEASSPFRETDYEPEILLNFRTRFGLLGLTGRFVQIGFNHQSNGQTEALSRSWNRVVANVGLEWGDFSLLVKGWYRIPEDRAEDDNPDIYDYLGYGELWGYYFWNRHRFAAMLRDNLDLGENRGAIQLEWAFPLFRPTWPTPARLFGYVQWYLGYGESLLDYDHRVNRIGVGFVIAEWY